jgi:hypothetical protein
MVILLPMQLAACNSVTDALTALPMLASVSPERIRYCTQPDCGWQMVGKVVGVLLALGAGVALGGVGGI